MLYIPLLPVYVYGALRTRRLLYFTAANPGIEMGGFFGEKKDQILDMIPEAYKVLGVHVQGKWSEKKLVSAMATKNIHFPVIAKPNVGERGEGVQKIEDIYQLVRYHETEHDFLIQEFVDYPLELGVLYAKMPGSSEGTITSVTLKKFLTVLGDGKRTVQELVNAHPRHRLYADMLMKCYPERMSIMPALGEEYEVHRIGNHSKGTQFLDANPQINQSMVRVFDVLTKEMKGVFYGRYDLKVPSFEDLTMGENIKIFELNGVSSEPGHMYDQRNILSAYKILAEHWLHLVEISNKNIKKGVETTPLSFFLTTVKSHFLK